MKAITKRVCTLDESFAAELDEEGHNLAELIRESRRDEIAKGRGVSRIRRRQLRHGNGTVCGWRLRTSVAR
jgi:hypothetical protein